jgi:Uncharacterized conserved protein
MTILTIGHSTHPIERFIEMLQANGVRHLIDVRRYPRSRRNPQFNLESLSKTLPAAGIQYTHMPGLGGMRKARPDSINTAWQNASFRGYADYMQTAEFERELAKLESVAGAETTAIMCAESVPWQCHRSLISDALTARGVSVEHILSETQRSPHRMTEFAKVEGSKVIYPAAQATLF